MKQLKKPLHIAAAATTIVFVLGGCANKFAHPTKEEFRGWSTEKQDAWVSNRNSDFKDDKKLQDTLYKTEEPTWHGQDDMSYTLLWDQRLNLIHMATGHQTGTFGFNTVGTVTFEGDVDDEGVPNGKIRKARDRFGVLRPVVVMANVASQEALGRIMVRGGFQVGSALMNGALAAKITSDGRCHSCGGFDLSLTNIGGINESSSAVNNESTTTAEIDISTMPGG